MFDTGQSEGNVRQWGKIDAEYQSGSPIAALTTIAAYGADRADAGAALRRYHRAGHHRPCERRPVNLLCTLSRQRRPAGEWFYPGARRAEAAHRAERGGRSAGA